MKCNGKSVIFLIFIMLILSAGKRGCKMWILFKLAEALTRICAELPCACKRSNRLIDLHC